MNLVEAHQLPKHANLKEVLVSRCKQWLIHQTTSHAEWSNSPKLQRGGVSQTRTSGRHSQCHEPHICEPGSYFKATSVSIVSEVPSWLESVGIQRTHRYGNAVERGGRTISAGQMRTGVSLAVVSGEREILGHFGPSSPTWTDYIRQQIRPMKCHRVSTPSLNGVCQSTCQKIVCRPRFR
jgi:hypothetical protein